MSIVGALRDCKRELREVRILIARGQGRYLIYLIRGYFLPKWGYSLFFSSPAKRWLPAGLGFILLALIFGIWKAALFVAFLVLAFYAIRLTRQQKAFRRAEQEFAVPSSARPLERSELSSEMLEKMEHLLDSIHARGFTGLDLQLSNWRINPQDQTLSFTGFKQASFNTDQRGFWFYMKRDHDRCAFNRLYGTDIMTEQKARKILEYQKKNSPEWYGHIDFGQGLGVGRFWSLDNGMGRWEFLNKKHMPSVRDKRILDLGANNGTMAMMMLRNGAKEVIGIEHTSYFVEQAKAVKEIFEWRDIKKYPLQMLSGDMCDILRTDYGKFDLVTAFCSLYYVPPEDMVRIVKKASEISPAMAVQANNAIPENKAKSQFATVSFSEKLLKENGFPVVQVFEPEGFSRPLLVGTKNSADSVQQPR